MKTKPYYLVTDDAPEMTLDLLGGKGFHLVEMTKLGIRVPPAAIITTEMCRRYQQTHKAVMDEIRSDVVPAIKKYLTGQFGYMPLVSVRSGAKFSMPGMMDTILNVGLDGKTEPEWVKRLGGKCAADSMHRLVTMYANVVKGLDRKKFESNDLITCLTLYSDLAGSPFPDADEQLVGAIEAVFRSWDNERAKSYRKMNGIPDDLGTAVVVQAMVFGNRNEQSCTGVLFSRNPSSGASTVVGEFLVGAQGEDVVAGIRTPEQLTKMPAWNKEVAEELLAVTDKLEKHMKDMVDVEFTVDDGKLYLLQCRAGKRTAMAAIQIAVDLHKEGLLTVQEAVKRVTLKQFLTATRPMIDPTFKLEPTIKGIPASNGVAKGKAVTDSKAAVAAKEPCILVTDETTPEDIDGMYAAKGILTRTGGATSHAAVVARGMDKVCVVGCTDLPRIMPGTMVTIDGASGSVWIGTDVPVVDGSKSPAVEALKELMVAAYPYMRVVTNPEDVRAERSFFATFEMDDDEDAQLVKEMTKVVETMKSGVIDLTVKADLLEPEDRQVMGMYGDMTSDALDSIVSRKAAALMSVSAKGKEIWVIGNRLSPAQKKGLLGKGYKLVPVLDSIENLIMAEKGFAVMDTAKLMKGTSSAAYAKLMKLKAAAGEEFDLLTIADATTPEAFGNGSRIAMSDMAAMQSLLGR